VRDVGGLEALGAGDLVLVWNGTAYVPWTTATVDTEDVGGALVNLTAAASGEDRAITVTATATATASAVVSKSATVTPTATATATASATATRAALVAATAAATASGSATAATARPVTPTATATAGATASVATSRVLAVTAYATATAAVLAATARPVDVTAGATATASATVMRGLAMLATTLIVVEAWLAERLGQTNVGPVLPADVSTWRDTGFWQVTVVGGDRHQDYHLKQPVVRVSCWAATGNPSDTPPWRMADDMAERVCNAVYTPEATMQDVQAAGAQESRLIGTSVVGEPRRIPDDPAGYARVDLDVEAKWVTL
jgi:hypothetical protein